MMRTQVADQSMSKSSRHSGSIPLIDESLLLDGAKKVSAIPPAEEFSNSRDEEAILEQNWTNFIALAQSQGQTKELKSDCSPTSKKYADIHCFHEDEDNKSGTQQTEWETQEVEEIEIQKPVMPQPVIEEQKPTESSGPRQISFSISPYAQEMILKLEEALKCKDAQALSELAFDADCEGLEDQIDIRWYEQMAIKLSKS